jgi:hypothetical protein
MDIMSSLPRVTFGMIVLNGEPFLRYNLRSIYRFAHQIIVVEGASPLAACIANPQGHSTDTTLETLYDFKASEDPENKITIVTAEDCGHPNGFWPGEKDEQSRAYSVRTSGDYLWQVDVDEFYRDADMMAVLEMLRDDPGITAVSFKQLTFWGGFDYVVDSWYLRSGADIYHRLFKWQPGYCYRTHRPPTVVDALGNDLRKIQWITGDELYRHGIKLYHYSLLFPKQVVEKALYYSTGPWGAYSRWSAYSSGVLAWARYNFLGRITRPFQMHNVHSYASWIKRFDGDHPEQVQSLRSNLETGQITITCRNNSDVEELLRSRKYQLGIRILEKTTSLVLQKHFLRILSVFPTRIAIHHLVRGGPAE